MVEDDVLVVTAPDGVRTVGEIAARIEVAQAETHIADDHVIGVDHDRAAGDADAAARGGLPRNGEVAVPDAQVARQVDRAGHVEDHDAFARSLGGGAERTGARVVEVGDVVDLAPAAARRVHAAALGAGEGAQHAVVLVGQGKPQVDAGIDGRTVGGEGYRLGVGRVVSLLLRNRFHAETVGRIGRKARQFNGRPDRRGGPAGSRIVPFVKLVGVFRRPGDRRPGERGRIVRLLDEPHRGSAEHVARENHEIGELRVLPFGGTERSRGKHAETIGNTRLHFETLRPEARRGRLQGRRGVAGIEFEGEAHGLDRLGDAPAHGGRLVRNRDGDIGHGKDFHVGSRRRGIIAATDGKGQHRGQQ